MLYVRAKGETFAGSHPAAEILGRAAGVLQHRLPPSLAQARVKASVGQGNWATVPWIAVLHPRETTSTQRGTYPVLLISEDLRGVYLTVAQGVTELRHDRERRRLTRLSRNVRRRCVLAWEPWRRGALTTAKTVRRALPTSAAITQRR